jgi:acyl-CoA synthetase (AMP-forming)/AMP-acid ligase II
VVGVPDEYSGELPFAFVALSANAARRAASGDAEKIKASIIKVRLGLKAPLQSRERLASNNPCSM